jgi:hypothetical protein
MDTNASQETFIIGLGHPRCGSKFASQLLSTNGLSVGHERIHQNGIISWMLIAERECNPWGDSLGKLKLYKSKFLVARSPLSSMVSIMGENQDIRSFAWRVQVVWEILNIDLMAPDIIPQNALAWAVASFTLWYEIALTLEPIFIFRVDRIEDDRILTQSLGISIQRSDTIPRNSRPERHDGLHFEPQMLANLPRTWTVRFAKIAQLLGYPEDAAEILKHTCPYVPPHRR